MRTLLLIVAVATGIAPWSVAAQEVSPAGGPDSLKFAVIGDNGSGEKPQYDIGQQMTLARSGFPFELVLMLGDNMYGRQRPEDFVDKFERPYAALLQAGIPFYATLGNHDNQSNRFYKGFNMGGERYYTFARKNVRFFVFDTNLMDAKQVAWIEDALRRSQDDWKIAYFHHPLYSDGARHGSNIELRVVLEPLLVRHGVGVVFSGHEHVYERTTAQKGITYFIEGSSEAVQGVLFLFGLVNAGVILNGYDTGTWAVLIAAMVGRPIGIMVAVALAVTAGLHLPRRFGWREVIVVALATSSGFTMSLFLASGVLPIGAVLQQIKLGALLTAAGAVVALGAARIIRVGRFAA